MRVNLNKIGKAISKSIPHIFTTAGIIWFGISVGSAYATGKKIAKSDISIKDKDDVKEIAKMVLPTVGSFMIGAACVIMSDACNARIIRATDIAYRKLSSNFAEYKAAVIGACGAEANQLAMKKAAEDHTPDNAEKLEAGYYHFYDTFSRNDFVAKIEDVIAAEYEANRQLAEFGFLSANDWYDLIGLCHVELGDKLGWDVGELSDYFGVCWLDFSNIEHTEDDGMKWYSIHYSYDPAMDGIIDDDVDWNSIKEMINRSGQSILPEQI
jgi:hypothetical protein